MEGLPLAMVAMAGMRASSTTVAGKLSGSRAKEGAVESVLLLVPAWAAPSSAEECYSPASTNFDYGATFFLSMYPAWFSDLSGDSVSYPVTFF